MLIGYARVSTLNQNLGLQIDALEKFGCDKIFSDKKSSRKVRASLKESLDYVRDGDTFVVWKLDRLCRSTKELLEIVSLLNEKNVSLHSLTEQIDTSTPAGTMFLTILGALAEMERELANERIIAGLEQAKKQGRKLGRPCVNQEKIKAAKQLIEHGMSYAEVAEKVELGVSTLYKHIPIN